MEERRFEVLHKNNVLASDMRLEDALLFINAIFDKYYMEHSMVISIKEVNRDETIQIQIGGYQPEGCDVLGDPPIGGTIQSDD